MSSISLSCRGTSGEKRLTSARSPSLFPPFPPSLTLAFSPTHLCYTKLSTASTIAPGSNVPKGTRSAISPGRVGRRLSRSAEGGGRLLTSICSHRTVKAEYKRLNQVDLAPEDEEEQ